uniref:Uncharacterized protein n=1 Tax=Chenopodium quinoa TaxID=63459 RepID=A0A803N5X1_CHEQI
MLADESARIQLDVAQKKKQQLLGKDMVACWATEQAKGPRQLRLPIKSLLPLELERDEAEETELLCLWWLSVLVTRLFVKLTIMIEDPREVERRRLIGIDDSDGPTREDLVAALEEVNDGKIPRDRVALRMLAEEMTSWPNLEAEPSKKTTKNKSLYAKATDTGIDPVVAAKRLNMDWDSAAEIETAENSDDTDVPPVVVSLCSIFIENALTIFPSFLII